ncbi:MAG TPA: protein kinase [Polyangiaceae bacterium]|jgi:serine/threonine-protein kinase
MDDFRSSRDPVRERARARLGQTILGKFRLDTLLGVGGMASVYAATHRNGNRVALKILHEHVSMDPDVRRLFRREGLAANRVDHPGVVRVLDDDVTADGCGFLVMPLLVGETLQARLDRLKAPLPVRDALLVAHAVLDVLAAAHAQGVVHRDIKPENVFITAEGELRVLDFGVARLLESTGEAGAPTRAGQAIGTPAFMAPEQALGRTGEIDAQSDLWSVGATLFLCLSGKRAHGAETTSELLIHAATRPARSLREVMPEADALLAQVVDRALAFEKKDRWADARAMQAALDGVYTFSLGEPIPPSVRLAPPPADVLQHLEQRALEGVDPFAPTSAEAGGGGGSERVSGATRREAPAITADARASGATRKRGRPVVAVAVAALAVAAAIGVGIGRWGNDATKVTADAAPPPTSPARAKYEEAVQAWRDATLEASKKAILKANELDPALVSADLLWFVQGFTPAQEHFQRAWDNRATLSPPELAVLEALEPVMHVPPDRAEAKRRLEAACARFPGDTECAFAKALEEIALGKLDAAEATFDRLLERDPTFASGWFRKAIIRMKSHDMSAAVADYHECLKLSPYSTACTTALANLDAAQGDCAEMERLARQLVTISPKVPTGYSFLGNAILGRGGSLESVREVFEQGWSVTSEAARKEVEPEELQKLSILAGDFDGALARQKDLLGLLASASDEPTHAALAEFEMSLYLELGDAARATRAANDFAMRKDAWASDGQFDYSILSSRTRYLAGTLRRDEFRAQRQNWAEKARAAGLRGSADMTWVMGFGRAVKTSADADEALQAAPTPGALPAAGALAGASVEGAMGYVSLLTGNLEAAREHLARAGHACSDEEPIEKTQAELHLGETLERLGDEAGACTSYRVVVNRWGREPRSISGAQARARATHLHCP